MKYQKIKHIVNFKNFVTIVIGIFAILSVVLPKTVFAGGDGSTKAICIPADTGIRPLLQADNADFANSCSLIGAHSGGSIYLKAGQATPNGLCFYNGDKVDVYKDSGGLFPNSSVCAAKPGFYVAPGAVMPNLATGAPTSTPPAGGGSTPPNNSTPNTPPTDSVAPGSTAKNNTDKPPEYKPYTNKDREEIKSKCSNRNNAKECLKENPLVKWTMRIINFLSIGVIAVVVIMVIIGGIQYASAGPNPQQLQSAKKKIASAIIALVAYFFLYAFLQYLAPGGIF